MTVTQGRTELFFWVVKALFFAFHLDENMFKVYQRW